MPLNPLLPPPRHYGRRGRLLRYEWENRGTTASGKTRWYDTDTKKTRYQKSKPGTGRQKKQPDEGGGKQPAEKKPTAGKKPPTPRKPKVDHQAVGAQIEKMIDGGFSEQDVADLKEQLQGLTVAQLGELKKKFNLKGGGRTKADVAGRLGAHAEGGRKAPAGEQPPTPRPAPRKPPISFGPEDADGILGEENPAPRRGALGDADAEREARIRAHTERVAAEEPKRAATGGGGRPRKTATRPAQAKIGVAPSAVPGTPEHPVPRLPEPPVTGGGQAGIESSARDLARLAREAGASQGLERELAATGGDVGATLKALASVDTDLIDPIARRMEPGQPPLSNVEIRSLGAAWDQYRDATESGGNGGNALAKLVSVVSRTKQGMANLANRLAEIPGGEAASRLYADAAPRLADQLVDQAVAPHIEEIRSGRKKLTDYPPAVREILQARSGGDGTAEEQPATPPAREQRNRAGLGRAPMLQPRPKRPPQEPAPTPTRSAERAPGSRPSATTRNRLTSGVRKQMGPAPKPVRIGRGGQRLNARSPVAVILHARNPLAVRPLLYGWVRSASRSGRPVWVSDTNPRDRRYQENRPGGGRPGQHAPVGTVPIEEHLRRILEAPYDVADYYLTSLQGRLRRLKPAALEALKRQFPALEQ